MYIGDSILKLGFSSKVSTVACTFPAPQGSSEGMQRWQDCWNLDAAPSTTPTKTPRRRITLSSTRELESAAIVAVCGNLFGDASIAGNRPATLSMRSRCGDQYALLEETDSQISDNDFEVIVYIICCSELSVPLTLANLS